MNVSVLDRLGAVATARGGATLLGRFVLPDGAVGGLFLNSVPVRAGTFVVPDSRGNWRLLRDAERLEGTFPRAQMPDALDAASIRAVGHSLDALIARGGTWLDVLDISPLVPGMSSRAEVQPFEQLLHDNIGHLAEVCRRPRTHLRVEVERMAVSRARRSPAQAANFLAAHTEDWERPTLRSVIPKRILADVREEQFDIYENRIAARLVDHLMSYLRERIREVTRLLRVFEQAAASHDGAAGGSHWRQARVYKLWGEALHAGEAKRKAERTLSRLDQLLWKVSGLMDSVLYREVPRRASVSTTLTMTNILTDDGHYRRVAELWFEWARVGRQQSVSATAYFEEMQDLCRSFDAFALLLTLRALDQLGFEPSSPEQSLASGQVEVRSGRRLARLSWAADDGAISLQGEGVETLRIVPLCGSVAALDDDQIRSVLADADAHAGRGAAVLLLYPSPPDADTFEGIAPDLATRLRSLSHEVGDAGRPRVGFLPVSPWDISSVERVARQLRWVTTAPTFLAYPPTIARPHLTELSRTGAWFEVAGAQLRIVRAPLGEEALPAKQFVRDADARLRLLEAERERVALQLHKAVRDRAATGSFNAQKKELNAQITDAEVSIRSLKRFEADLDKALGVVEDLLRCPTCNKRADARYDFTPMGQSFSCRCSECSTTWGTVACGGCSAQIPVLRLPDRIWMSCVDGPGWVDGTLGADVLAPPTIAGTEVRFVCPSCGGDHAENADS